MINTKFQSTLKQATPIAAFAVAVFGLAGADVAAAATFTVNRTGDTAGTQCLASGCNIRQAITAANATAEADIIVFNIPACGVRTINITGTTLRLTRPVSIRGATQPLCGNPIPGDRTSMIEIRGPGVNVFPGGLVLHGLVLDAGSSGSDVSGLAIGGFSGSGIGIASSNNSIFNNKLGTDATGRLSRPNNIGLATNNGTGNDISDNLVAANSSMGLNILSDGNEIYANEIGISVDGDPLGNGGDGISTFGAEDNLIGIDAALGNTIANNGGAGVRIGLGDHNEILGNKISNNGGLGIVLQGAGANNGQVAPVITSVTRSFEFINTTPPRIVSMTRVQGTLANVSSSSFVVDLYSNDACDPSGAGEGQKFFRTASVTSTGTFSIATSAVPGAVLTAVARSPDGDSSQFSTCRNVPSLFLGN